MFGEKTLKDATIEMSHLAYFNKNFKYIFLKKL